MLGVTIVDAEDSVTLIAVVNGGDRVVLGIELQLRVEIGL